MVPHAPRLLLTVEALRRVEASTLPRHPLMERAGTFLADHLMGWAAKGHPIVFLCGPGNNGGDGLVAARLLRARGFDPQVIALSHPQRPADAAAAWQGWLAAGGSVHPEPPALLPGEQQAVIVDACFGIGLTRPIAPPYAHWIEWANCQNAHRIAVDIPSGLDADTGTSLGPVTFCAAETVTFLADKPGLHTADGPDYAGEVRVATLAVDAELAPWYQRSAFPVTNEPAACSPAPSQAGLLLAPSLFCPWLKPRPHNTHKGNYGHAVVIGGATGMVGAVHLAARAALMLGAGKVSAIALSKTAARFDPLAPEVMWPQQLPGDATALAIGPGLGRTSDSIAWLQALVDHPAPIVIDADALNLAASAPTLAQRIAQRRHLTVITPHPGEAARLLGVTTREVQEQRIAAAHRLATQLGAVVVLKGCGAIIAEPNGHWAINPSGHGGMASGGMGDALTGLIAALLAQGWPPFPAAACATLLHGAAAEALSATGIGPAGLTASETLAAARALFNQWCRDSASTRQPAQSPSNSPSSP